MSVFKISGSRDIYKAARELLKSGKAQPSDIIETWRGSMLCLSGVIGTLAKWRVQESDDGRPSLSLQPYEEFPEELKPGTEHD
jgi:hypothetical protein